MKKFFSVLIAFTMIFSSLVSFAEETTNTTTATESTYQSLQFSDVEKGSVVESAVENLVANNIINGYPDGTFKPNGDITRAEFAAVIARFKGIATNLAEDAVTGFTDLDTDDSYKWARPYVKAAVDSGIINGFEDGTFRASEYVTYEQAVKMIVCAIDYHAMANNELLKLKKIDANARWSAGYISAAGKAGISKNAVVQNVAVPANRGLVAILTNNAFSAPKVDSVTDKKGNVSYSTGSSGSSGGGKSDTTEDVKGVVTATEYTALDSQDSGLEERQIKIDDKVYELEESIAESTNYLDLIGKRVVAVFSKREDKITRLEIKTGYKASTTLKEEYIVRPFEKDKIKYLDSDYKNKEENVSDFIYIYNGKYIPDATFDMFDSDGPYPFTNGEIEILEDLSTKIIKITNYEVFAVRRYDSSNKKISFKYKKKYNGEDSYVFSPKPSECPVIYKDNSRIALDKLSLKEYDIVNLMESPKDSAGAHAKIMRVSTGGHTGYIKEELVDGREILIGDDLYYLTNDYANYEPLTSADEEKHPFRINDRCDFYLDYTGQIAAIKYSMATSATNYKYGYLALVDYSDEKYRVILIDENGKTDRTKILKSTLVLDGKKTNASAVATALLKSAKVANASYNESVSKDEKWKAEQLTGDYYAQPIRYSVSGSTIDGIDTVLKEYGGPEDMLECTTNLAGGKITATTSTIGSNSVNSKTKILYVPDNRKDYNSYRSMSNSDAFSITKQRYVEVYALTGTASYILIYQTNPLHEFKGSSPYMMVSFVDSQGEFINGFGKNTGTTPDRINIADGDKFKTDIDPKCVTVSDLNKGDIIQYVTDSKSGTNEVVAIRRLYNAKNPAQAKPVKEEDNAAKSQRYFDASVGNTYLRVSYGTLLTDSTLLENNKARFTWFISDDSDELPKKSVENTIVFNASNANFIEFNGSEVERLETTKDPDTGIISAFGSIATMDESNPSEVIIMSSSIAENSSAACIFVINTDEPKAPEEEPPTDEPVQGEPTDEPAEDENEE